MADLYDVVIIGGGPGGYVAAIRAAQLGARVALVEMERIGGCCLNRGCIPTKTLYRNVENYLDVRRASEFGVDIDGELTVNFARMMARKDEVVETLVGTVIELLKAHRVDLYDGFASLEGRGLVHIEPSRSFPDVAPIDIRGKAIIVATGSRTTQVPIPGTDLPGVVSSRGLLRLTKLPESMVVIGASVVGLEFTSMFSALGCKVNVLGRKTFMKSAEEQLAKRFRSLMMKNNVGVNVGVDFQEIVQTDGGKLSVKYVQGGKERTADGAVVLLSTGRTAFTAGLGLDALGVNMEGPRVLVDQYMQTNVAGVYAIGDVLGTYMLAHVASYEGEVAVDNILGRRREADYRAVPYCIFTVPEVAGVGLTEREAKEQGLDFVVARFPFTASGKALAMAEQEGQIRMICEKEPDGMGGRVLGVHIMGPRASDLIAEATMAMQLCATAKDIAETIHAHPTLPEATMEAAKAAAFGEAIHYRKV
jgi:dihydrolipoamide dehydrogenase